MDDAIIDRAADIMREALRSGKSEAELVSAMSSAGYSSEEISSAMLKAKSCAAASAQTHLKCFCTKCGKRIEAGELFCTGCGNPIKLPEPQPFPPEQRMRYCPNCRDPVRPSEIFCDKCGRKLRDAPAQQEARSPAKPPMKGRISRKKKAAAVSVIAILIIATVSIYYILGREVAPAVAERTAYGEVYDYSNKPLGGVTVSADKLKTRTDDEGRFELPVSLPGRQTLTFESSGLVPVHKILPEDARGRIYYKVLMPKQEPFISLSQESGGTAETDNTELDFGEKSFMAKGKNLTPQTVLVSLTYFDPREERDSNAFPGEFEALQGSAPAPIESFGFAKLMVQDSSGDELDLAEGKNATLRIRIAGDAYNAPDTMPLWYFDVDKGYWVYKTTARRYGYFYEGEIDTVASWWNCDRSFERSWFDFKFGKDLDKLLSGINWELIWDIAGVIYEPLDWAHNIYTLLNPKSSAIDRLAAVVSFLPLVNHGMAKGIIKALTEAASLPTVERFLSREGVKAAAEIAGKLYEPVGVGTNFVTLLNSGASGADRVKAAVEILKSADHLSQNAGSGVSSSLSGIVHDVAQPPYSSTASPASGVLPSVVNIGGGSQANFVYDAQGYPIQWGNDQYSVSADYSAGHSQATVTISDLGSGSTSTQNIAFSATGNSLTIENLATGVDSELLFNSDFELESATMQASGYTATYASGGYYPPTIVIAPVSPGQLMNLTLTPDYDEETGMGSLQADFDFGQNSTRITETAAFDSGGNLTYMQEEYFNGTGYNPPMVYSETMSLSYINDSAAGSGQQKRLSYVTASLELPGQNTVQLSVDLSDAYRSYADLPAGSQVDNGYMSVTTEGSGQVSELRIYAATLSAMGIRDPPAYISIQYDSSGNPSGAELPDGSSVTPVYDSSGAATGGQVEMAAPDPQEARKVRNFLETIGMNDTMFKVQVTGVGYNYMAEQYFDPTEDAHVLVGAKNESAAGSQIMMGDTAIFSKNLTAGKVGNTTEVLVGPMPIAGARVTVNLDTWYSAPISGFLVFESHDGLMMGSLPVSLAPAEPQAFMMPLPADTAGELRFQTFDFVTSGAYVKPIERLTIADISIGVPRDCANQRTVILVFDISGSMEDPSDANPGLSKLELEKAVLKDLIKNFGENTKYGLVAFDETARTFYFDNAKREMSTQDGDSEDSKLLANQVLFGKSDEKKVLDFLDDVSIIGGTDIQEGLLRGIALINKTTSPVKRIILLTDGASEVDFDRVAKALPAGVQISTIGIFGSDKAADAYDPVVLQKVADLGNGTFYEAGSYQRLYSSVEVSAKRC